ncbi:MAG: glycine zipper 2TM domain-containing protein [Sediminibacterium sp.]|nr:glycine zipper 2TM domain-containing protein [Sediminibacterium sp.]
MSEEDNDFMKPLITGGLIGAALGALLSKNKDEGAIIGALLGATFSATLKANEEAQKTHVPFYVEEGGKLFRVEADGSKTFIRTIEKPTVRFPDQFKLE